MNFKDKKNLQDSDESKNEFMQIQFQISKLIKDELSFFFKENKESFYGKKNEISNNLSITKASNFFIDSSDSKKVKPTAIVGVVKKRNKSNESKNFKSKPISGIENRRYIKMFP